MKSHLVCLVYTIRLVFISILNATDEALQWCKCLGKPYVVQLEWFNNKLLFPIVYLLNTKLEIISDYNSR